MKIKLLAFLLLFCLNSNAHEYFFAFVEAEYNDVSGRIESTLIVSTHDLENALSNENIDVSKIDQLKIGTKSASDLEYFINKHLSFSTNENQSKLKLVGIEVLLSGDSQIYLESEPINIIDEVVVHFDLLMDKYQSQQNKITLFYRGIAYTKTFMFDSRTQALKFENN